MALNVAVVASQVGQSPEDATHSFIFDQARILAEKGVEVHIFRPKFELQSVHYGVNYHGLRKVERFEAIGHLIRNLPMYPPLALFRRPTSTYMDNLYATSVSNCIGKYDVDIIHAHFACIEGFVGFLAKKSTNKPLVVTLHGFDVNVVPEIGYGLRLSKRYDSIVRKVLNNADVLVCVSSDMLRKVQELDTPGKTCVIFNGVDLNRFHPPNDRDKLAIQEIRRLLGVGVSDTLVLNARRLRKVYGLEYFLMGAKLVSEEVKNAKFIVAGEGECREALTKMVVNLGLTKNVKLIGNFPRNLMPVLMQASDIYANTSLSDGTPPSVLEALATARPVVSFDVGGIADIIDDDVNGHLVSPKDYEDLAAKITRLLRDTERRLKMGEHAKRVAEAKFDLDKKTDEIISIYKGVWNPS